MEKLLALVLLFSPFVGFLIAVFLGKKIGKKTTSIISTFFSFLLHLLFHVIFLEVL